MGPLAILGLVVLVVFVLGWSPVARWRMRHIPGLTGYWLLGNLPDIVKLGQHILYTEGNKKFGPVFKIWLGGTPVVVIGDGPAGRAIALRAKRRHFFMFPMTFFSGKELEQYHSEILITQDEEYHGSLKAAWPGAFRSVKMEEYVAKMNRSVVDSLETVGEAASQGKELELASFFGNLAMDVVGGTAFGLELGLFSKHAKSEDHLGTKVVHGVRELFDSLGMGGSFYATLGFLFQTPITIPLLRACASVCPDKTIAKILGIRAMLRGLLNPLMERAKAKAKGSSAGHAVPDQATKASKGNDAVDVAVSAGPAVPVMNEELMAGGGFLGHLVETPHRTTGKPFSDAEIMAQAMSFLGAGYETTAMHLAFTFYLLGKNPDKLANLRKELDGLPSGDLTLQDVESLPYLTGCLKESMRLYPVGVILVREAPQDLNICGFYIPKGTWLHVNLTWVGRNPDYWRRPEEFLPERWVEGTPEAAHTPENCHYNFGDGSLQCAGMRFAVLETKLTVARFLQKFDFVLSPGQEELPCKSIFTLNPREGVFATPKLRATPAN